MEKSNNKKIVFGVIFAIVAIILAYAFTVIYFFYLSPNDISARLRVYSLLSDEAIGNQYAEAIVEINFTATEDLEDSDVTVFGVNVREDGYVVASFYEFDYDQVGTLSIISSDGGVYGGQIVFSDETLNLSIIKLTSAIGKEISLPYVRIYSSEIEEDVEIISVQVEYAQVGTSTSKVTTVETGTTYGVNGAVSWVFDEGENYEWIKYFNDDVFLFDASGYVNSGTSSNGAFIFDRRGRLMGLFSFGSDNGYGFATTASNINLVIDDVVETYETSQSAYSSAIVSALKGLSAEELYYHSEMGNVASGTGEKLYYFAGLDRAFTDSITNMLDATIQDYENFEFKWFYLVEDFVYGEVKITADSVLTEIEVNGTATSISSHIEFVKLLYGLQSGDTVKICFYSDYGDADESTTVESVTFEI